MWVMHSAERGHEGSRAGVASSETGQSSCGVPAGRDVTTLHFSVESDQFPQPIPERDAVSEYQYYEFRAIDRPLDDKARAALRAITSRARITSTSLVNEYHFGDFKGNPDRLMDQYFDAHIYYANWGSRRLVLRVPVRSFEPAAAKPYLVPDTAQVRHTTDHVVFDFHSESEGDDFFGDEAEEEGGWLASMIPLRADLMAGDLRCLYLGWLAGVESGEVDEGTTEPPVPPGLFQLSAPLQVFADFLRVDPDLIEVAAAASGEAAPTGLPPEELADWVAQLPGPEKDAILVRVIQGETGVVAGELLRRFRKDQAAKLAPAGRGRSPGPGRRTVGALLAARNRLAEENARKAGEKKAKEQANREREQAAARARHLDTLVGREKELWEQVEAAATSKKPKEYDRAVTLLKDLHDLARRTGTAEAFATRSRQLCERHAGKRTLIKRFDKAGLTG
ncbi:MAG: hypothetical protein JWO38_5895 [Gemmataceae bacterium]|nr:hypothetical protein [Gemmataceae bacterium]